MAAGGESERIPLAVPGEGAAAMEARCARIMRNLFEW
jgi:hypothetical protein